MKTIKDIRKSLIEKYSNYEEDIRELVLHMNKVNELLPKLIRQADELLEATEATIKLKQGIEANDKE